MNDDGFPMPIWAPAVPVGIGVAVLLVIVGLIVRDVEITAADKRACRRSGRAVVTDECGEWTCREVKP